MENIDRSKLTIIRLIILLMCAMIIPVSLIAQDMKAGIKGGVNFSNFASLDNTEDQGNRTGFHAGVFAQLPVSEFFAVQPELTYSTKGTKADYNIAGFEGEAKYNLNYLDIPVLAVFKLGESADIQIGPYVGFLLNKKVETDIISRQFAPDDSFKNVDFGMSAGFALNFDPISVGTRYNYGITKINETEASEAGLSNTRNSNAQIFIAFDLSN